MRISLYALSACIVTLAESSKPPGRPIDRIRSSFEKNRSFLSTSKGENLKRLLDYLRQAPEFFPLTLSVIVPDSRSPAADFLTAYIIEKSIDAYTVRADDLSLMAGRPLVRLTWILFVDDLHTLRAFVQWQEELWQPANQYVIVFTGETGIVPWRTIFEDLWKRYNVYRVVVLTARDDFRCLVKYMPLELRLRHEQFGAVHKLCLNKLETIFDRGGNWIEGIDRVSRIGDDRELFQNFRDLKNYPVDVVLFESLMMNVSYDEEKKLVLSKVDADVMISLERAMRAKFRIKVLGKFDSNQDPFDTSLRLMENGKTALIGTGFFEKRYSDRRGFEFTNAVYGDKLCFIAPVAGLVPKSYMPFMPFEMDLWALLLVYNVVITVLWYLVKYLSESFHRHATIVLPLMADDSNESQLCRKVDDIGSEKEAGPSREDGTKDSLGPPEFHRYVTSCFYLSETVCYPLQGGQTPAQRSFLIGTLFFGLIVTGLYQSCLVSSLSKPFHYPELNTFEEIVNSDRPIITKYANLRRSFVDDSPTGKLLGQKIRVVNSSTPTNNLVAYTNVIAVARYSSFKLENQSMYFDKEGNKLLHLTDECPVTYTLAYVMRQQSPYRERINAILLNLREAGLVEAWYAKMIYPVEVEEKRRQFANKDRKIKLTLEHYSLSFLLLFAGLFAAGLLFLAEIYFANKLRVGDS